MMTKKTAIQFALILLPLVGCSTNDDQSDLRQGADQDAEDESANLSGTRGSTYQFAVAEASDTEENLARQRPYRVKIFVSPVSTRALTVPFIVSGTASLGGDVSLPASGEVAIPANADAGYIDFTVVDDSTYEVDETVEIVLLEAKGRVRRGPSYRFNLTIKNAADLPSTTTMPTVQFLTSSQAVAESTSPVSVTLQLSAASTQLVTVPISRTGTAGSADATVSETAVQFPAGTLTRTLSVTIADDTVDEADETIILTMGTPTNALGGTNLRHTITVADNDSPPSVRFAAAAAMTTETNTTANATVSLSVASEQPVQVSFAAAGTAILNSDYRVTAGNILFNAGETSKTIPIAILDDMVQEGDETVILTLSAPVNATLGSPASHTLTITANDAMAPTPTMMPMVTPTPTPTAVPTTPATPTATPSTANEGMSAFRDSVYVITRRDCVLCHGNPTSGLPQHASSDLLTAYSAARPLANFTDVTASRFVTRIKDGHCGMAVCRTDGQEMIDALRLWAADETTAVPPPTSGSALMAVGLKTYREYPEYLFAAFGTSNNENGVGTRGYYTNPAAQNYRIDPLYENALTFLPDTSDPMTLGFPEAIAYARMAKIHCTIFYDKEAGVTNGYRLVHDGYNFSTFSSNSAATRQTVIKEYARRLWLRDPTTAELTILSQLMNASTSSREASINVCTATASAPAAITK